MPALVALATFARIYPISVPCLLVSSFLENLSLCVSV
jgi:hypothetical protein